MSVLSYLKECSSRSVIKGLEKSSIKRSISIVKKRLKNDFKGELTDIAAFGSYARGTLLPRQIDTRSDVDLMVVFSDSDYEPQTYLDRLRRFVNKNYSSAEVYQSNPTIILTLNHINIELVPAIETFWSDLKIPAPSSNFSKWLSTDPNEFNNSIKEKNKRTGSTIKPVIRLAKYWNALNGYIFPSYELEKMIIKKWYWNKKNLQDYFFSAMKRLEIEGESPDWKIDRLDNMIETLDEIHTAERNNEYKHAEILIKSLLPQYW